MTSSLYQTWQALGAAEDDWNLGNAGIGWCCGKAGCNQTDIESTLARAAKR
jgi:hypothetical protein